MLVKSQPHCRRRSGRLARRGRRTWSLACLKTGRAGRQLGKTILEIRPQNGNHLCWHEAGVVPRTRNDTQLTPPSYRPPQGVAPFSYVLTVFEDALNNI